MPAEFPGLRMREICWPGRNAAVTKQLGWASQWRSLHAWCCLGTPMSLQTLSAVLCQPCQGCLMWPVPCAVGCARLGPPVSSGNVFLLKAHLSPFGWAGACSAASWGLSVPCLCHRCSSMPPACLTSCHQLLLHGEAPDLKPLVHCPTPPVSRETLDSQRQLCHENIFTVGYLSPRTFWGHLVHSKARGGAGSVRVSPLGTTPGTPGFGLCNPIL